MDAAGRRRVRNLDLREVERPIGVVRGWRKRLRGLGLLGQGTQAEGRGGHHPNELLRNAVVHVHRKVTQELLGEATEQGEATAERPNADQTLYTIPMRSDFTTTDFRNPWRAKNLAVLIQPFSYRCPGPSKDFSVRELHLFFRDTDLFVCIRPDLAAIRPDQAAGGVLLANRKLPVRPR